jgi:hypothetical protein
MNTFLLLVTLALFSVFNVMADDYKIVHTKGDVSILRSNKKISASKNSILQLKDKILTGDDSLAVIKSSKLTLKVVENSEVSIAELNKEIVVDVDEGGFVANYVKQKIKETVGTKLRVNTKHTSMGVRGTTFFAYNHKNQTSYLTVKEGEVEFKGKNSSTAESVSENRTAFTDGSLKNIKPKKVGFEEEINWELSNLKSNMSQPKKLFSKMEEQWNNYKKENEKKWKNHKDSMEDQWNKMKDQL